MAQGDSSDILMRILVRGKQALPGESRTVVDRTSMFLNDFHPNEIFEIDSFTFTSSLEDDSAGGMKAKADREKQALQKPAGSKPSAKTQMSSSGQFQSWRMGQNTKYGTSVPPVSFTRAVDKTSMLLLHHFIQRTTFDSVILVKRKATGSSAAGEPYLRLDFSGGVLLTEVSWQSGDPPQETCKFISRKINYQYRPQLPDGSLGEAVPGEWSSVFYEQGGR